MYLLWRVVKMLENRRRPRREINLIPLVNVIFLLLTFFMVAGTIEKTDPFAINLPEATKNGATESQKPTIIYLHKDGRIAVNNDLVLAVDFSTIINTIILENKGRQMIIKSDADAGSKDLIWLMRAIERVGGSDVSIVTKVVR